MKLMIHLTAVALCAALALSATACTTASTSKTTEVSSSSESVQIANPWVDCKTIEDAQTLAGFDFQLPKIPGYTVKNISALENEMIQVIYSNGQKEVCVRKATGTDDASGDYNTYDTSVIKELDGYDVTLKGNDDKFNLAIWTGEEYAYAVSISDALSEDDMTELAERVVLVNMLLGGDPATWGPATSSAN